MGELLHLVLDGLVVLAEALAQGRVVRQALEANELRYVSYERRAHHAHVELVGDVGLEPLDGCKRRGVAAHERQLRQREAHREIVAVADGPSELDELLHDRHVGLDLLVDGLRHVLRDLVKVHRIEPLRLGQAVAQVAEGELGEEGRERRHHFAHHHENLEECRQRGALVVGPTLARESLLI